MSSVFLRMLSLCIWSKFWFKWKAFQGCQYPCLFSHGCNTLTLYWLCNLLNSHVPWVHQNYHVHGVWQMLHENRATRNDGNIYHMFMPCSSSCFIVSHQMSFIKPKFKHKIIKISRQQQQSIKLNTGPVWEWGHMRPHSLYAREAGPVYNLFSHGFSL